MLLPKTPHQRILVVGTSCAGKTTLAAEIGAILGITHFDMDNFHWMPGWKMCTPEEFAEQIKTTVLPLKSWVVSGNYTTGARQTLWPAATAIIWLDYPLPLVLTRYFKRTWRRVVHKEPCCNGNYETLRNVFFDKDNLFFWILKTHYSRKPRYQRWMKEDTFGAQWVVLKGRRQTRDFIGGIG